MINIESLSLRLSNKLGKKLDKNQEEIAVLNYGLFVMIHTLMAIIVTIIVSILTNTVVEMITISMVSSWLKRYSGGVHATSPERCLIIGILITYALSRLSIYLTNTLHNVHLILITIVILIASYYIIYKKCPVSSKNKQFKNEKRIKMLRKKAFTLVNVYTLCVLALLYNYMILGDINSKKIVICILLGISLQVSVLTKYGKVFIEAIDKVLNIKETKNYIKAFKATR